MITTQMKTQPIQDCIKDCIGNTPLIRLNKLFPEKHINVNAKLEYMNPGGSMKDRPARFFIEQGIKNGDIGANSHIIESSSGNLGIALAMLSRLYHLSFTCVVDPKITKTNLKILKTLGANVVMVEEKDDQGGYLKSRIHMVKKLLQELPNGYWINQYANEDNWRAHYFGTGFEIAEQLDEKVDLLVMPVSTTGSIMGTSRRLKEKYPDLKVIAVDAVGSVIFNAPSGPREIPGFGASRVPEILNINEIDEVIYVNDKESVEGCRELLLREGMFAGGSSGSAVAAIKQLLPTLDSYTNIVTLFPDRGDRYIDTIYDESWVSKLG
ncbi:2,3-diaminopropionate biosynthesis protein SbnA [Fictibacillus sp. S7]|uniref:2,3-diaminopropionate biosynthesis protein SbnA n=1 Tax=Fictibacillus sp. S7 TaxID=2212476 RepID=UPI0010132324|nr:2,3-diaminopropionate biosynthesis protein SbnA [Fictibacillus sp. S7]RXZ02170.1 2,3-diaminopropionate biosynthesis protein SbnA [Fictibacillus sp. S7]